MAVCLLTAYMVAWSQMEAARTLLVTCSGEAHGGSFAVRSDNLVKTVEYDACRSRASKHCSSMCHPFVLAVNDERATFVTSTHVRSLVPKGSSIVDREIACIDSSDDYIAAGFSDGTARLWRVSDGELVVEQQLHIGGLSCVWIDSNLWLLFAASRTGRIGAWPIPSLFVSSDPDRVWSPHSLAVADVAVSRGYRVFSVSHDKTAKCFAFCAGCEILSLSFETGLTCCALAHNQAALYCGSADGRIFAVCLAQDAGTPTVFAGHEMEVCDVAVSGDDRALYSASLDLTVRRWDTATGHAVARITAAGVPVALAWVPDREVRGKRAFPRLGREIQTTREDVVSAPADDVCVLSLEDELAIALVDIGSRQEVVPAEEAGAAGPDEWRANCVFFQATPASRADAPQ